MKKYNLFLMLLVFVTSLVSCSDDEDDSLNNSEGTAEVAVKLTDAPGDYEEVWVEVQDVMIKMESETTSETETETESGEEDGWTSLGNVEPKEINLLDLTGGVTELLSEAEIPAGYLQEIRLVLGDNNSIIVDGQELVLDTPSAQQSGLKVKVNQELEADAYYTFILDFDVDQSVVSQGNGSYSLKPVLRLSVDETSGSIAGIVSPSTEPVLVEAQNAEVNVSAYTNAEGKFQLHGLQPGTYMITVTPAEGSGLQVAVLNNVEVEQGVVTELEEPILLEATTETETETETETGTGE